MMPATTLLNVLFPLTIDEEKQDKVPASEEEEVDEDPGGNVSVSCPSHRFRQATA